MWLRTATGPKSQLRSNILILLSASFNLCIVAYDSSTIANLNVVPQYYEYFGLSSSLVGLNTSIVSAGCVVFGPFAGAILDRLGRKFGMAMASVIVMISAVLQTTATTEAQFVVGRFFLGAALTMLASVAPIWVTELASPKHRTAMMATLMSTLPFTGIVSTSIVLGTWPLTNNWAWRTPLMLELLFPLLSLCILPFTPESPRWLLHRNRNEEALEVLANLHARGNKEDPLIRAECIEISESLEREKRENGPWKTLVTPRSNLRRFGIALLVQIFFQLTGSNTLLSFFPIILVTAGISSLQTTLLVLLGLCIWNFISVASGGLIIRVLGRKRTLVTGTIVMTIALVVLAILQWRTTVADSTSYGVGAVVMLFTFQFASCASWMNLSFSYPPEVLSFGQRAKGIAIAQSVGYAFSFLNLYTIPIAIDTLNWNYYAINAGWNVVIIAIMIFFFVETKGATLEQMDTIFGGGTVDGQTKVIAILDGSVAEVLDGKEASTSVTPVAESIFEGLEEEMVTKNKM